MASDLVEVHSLAFICCLIFTTGITADTQWVRNNRNQIPESPLSPSRIGNNFGQSNFDDNNRNRFDSSSSFPESPSRLADPQNNRNPGQTDTILVVGQNGDTRVIPGSQYLEPTSSPPQISNNGGLITIGGRLLSGLISNGPKLAGAAWDLLRGYSKNNNNNGSGQSGSNNNNIGSGQSGSNNNNIGSGQSGSNNNNIGSGQSGNNNNNIGSGSGQNIPSPAAGRCECVSVNICFLPRRPNGMCGGGADNVMCCQT